MAAIVVKILLTACNFLPFHVWAVRYLLTRDDQTEYQDRTAGGSKYPSTRQEVMKTAVRMLCCILHLQKRINIFLWIAYVPCKEHLKHLFEFDSP